MFCLWKTLKAYMQKPMCPWEAPSSKLLPVCQKYGPELLCWGNIWLHRLANVGQLAFSFQASFSTAFLHSHCHAKRSLEIAKLQLPRRSESQNFPVLQSAVSQWKTDSGHELILQFVGGKEEARKLLCLSIYVRYLS